jgi:hypothetical protein
VTTQGTKTSCGDMKIKEMIVNKLKIDEKF